MSQRVSVVIPTMGRDSLLAALRSVRAQTQRPFEVTVVLDAPEREEAVRSYLTDERLLVTDGRRGGGFARNLGTDVSSGDWIAYLDDDDHWDPRKLQEQLTRAPSSDRALLVCDTLFHQRGGNTRRLPERPYRAHVIMADYLVARPKLRHGTGYIQSSSLLVSRALIDNVAWDESLPRHQDWDYVIELEKAGAEIVVVEAPLVHVQQDSAGSVSGGGAWRKSLPFLLKHGAQMSTRTRVDFVLVQLIRRSLENRDFAGTLRALRYIPIGWPHWGAVAGVAYGAIRGARLELRAVTVTLHRKFLRFRRQP